MSYRVVILSARASNLIACVNALKKHEPELPPDHIVVVDDGARAEAESELPGITWISGQQPFIFARNANLGIAATGRDDVVLLNDDACLSTPRGLTLLAEEMAGNPDVGICSAGIQGAVGNPLQKPRGRRGIYREKRALAFVCVYLTRRLITALGPLDERFVGYGFEDNDYCTRALQGGFALGIWDGCEVDHRGHLPSTFRSNPKHVAGLRQNRILYRNKWSRRPAETPAELPREAPPEPASGGRVDLMYLACNRLEFTRETFTTLVDHTDWDLVHRLWVYDDGSVDGTREWLESQVSKVPAETVFKRTRFGSPVDAMNHFIRGSKATVLAKLDNDAMVPRGWLSQSLAVLDRHPELDLLGIEAMYPVDPAPEVVRSYTPAKFISGLGLYRRSAFARGLPRMHRKWFGLEEWQVAQGRRLGRGWITPALPVFLLDRIPFEPWRSYSDRYIAEGRQREWPKYDPSCRLFAWWQPSTETPETAHETPDPPASLAPAPIAAKPRFLAALRIKNESARIHEVITSVLPLCDRVLIFDDHSTDETVEICRSFGEAVTVLYSPFEGLDEARDKNHLMAEIQQLEPEWVLWIDGDEVLEKNGPDKLRRAADQHRGQPSYSLRVAYLWDDDRQMRTDGIFGRFQRPSMFRLAGQPPSRLRFKATHYGGNFHCGNVPARLAPGAVRLNVWLKHYGYLTREQRLRKYRWYNKIDPNNHAEDRYRHLAEIPGARFAPGPPRIVPCNL